MNYKLTFILILLSIQSMSQSWSKHGAGLSAGGVCVVDLSMPSDNVAWGIMSVFAAGTCGGVVPYYTRTGNGTSWVAGAIPLPADVTPVCISAVNATTAWIAAADISTNTTGYIYKTSNSGITWVQQSTAMFTDAVRFIHLFDSNEGVAVGDSSIYITTDGGTNWIFNGALPVPVAQIGSGITNFLLNSYEVYGNTIWLGDAYGNFYKSFDKGHTWTLLPNSIYPGAVKGIAFRDSLYGIAVAAQWIGGGSGSSGGSFADVSVFTTDGGMTWQPMTVNFTSANVVNSTAKYDVAYIPGTPNTFIVTSEYDATYAAFSAISYDGGASWSLLDSTEQHTVCVFTSPLKGFTGGYIPNFTNGIFKWTGITAAGITENKIENINLYPNPASDVLTIQHDLDEIKYLRITDVNGKTVPANTMHADRNKIAIDVSHFEKGMYFIYLGSDRGEVNAKFIH